MKALEEIALESYEELGRGGILITLFKGDFEVLLVSVDKNYKSDSQIKDSPALWLNKEVMEIGYIIVIEDVNTHPLCHRMISRHRFALGSYMGAPVISANNHTIGSVGAYFSVAHRWSDPEIELVQEASKKVKAAIEGDLMG